MATTLTRVRFFWGALDIAHESGTFPAYSPTQYVSLGPSAADAAGIGVRRATLIFDRTLAVPADDDINMHFDFLNMTSNAPDDTWTSTDYGQIEARLLTWWTAVKTAAAATTRLYRISWHQLGPGIGKPNPAERILDIATPVAGTSSSVGGPPQIASTISLRTGFRRNWGRTYFPIVLTSTTGRVTTTQADLLVASTVTLLQGTKTDDFMPVVYSARLGSALGVETVSVDDVADTVRRRRWKKQAYRKLTVLT
jgi:hypothetical protein